MSIFYGKTNSIQKSGSVELNLDYSLTPPTDTDKIWVKTSNNPNDIEINNSKTLTIDSSNIVRDTETINLVTSFRGNNASQGCYQGHVYMNGYLYIMSKTSDYLRINDNTLSNYSLWKINVKTFEYSALYSTSDSNYGLSCIGKYDDEHLIYTRKAGQYSGRIGTIDINTGAMTDICNLQNYDSFVYTSSPQGFAHRKLYKFNTNNVQVYSLATGNVEETYTYPASVVGRFSQYMRTIYDDTYIYFFTTDAPSDYSMSSSTTLYVYRFNFETHEIDKLTEVKGRAFYATNIEICGNYIFVLDNDAYSSSFMNTVRYAVIDLTTGNVSYFTSGDNSSRKITWIDEDNILHIIGGQTAYNGAYNYKYYKIKMNYTLENNKMLLYFDDNSNKSINIVLTEKLKMTLPINNCWIGDINDQANPYDMFYYDNNLWKGINCLGYTQLKDCSISANDASIDLYVSTINTQTITVTPTWAYEEGNITITATSGNTSTATVSLEDNELTITGVAVGNTTVTISVVDDYGTTFTKQIAVTVTDSTPQEEPASE